MNVQVTGSSGYIASQLVPALLGRGYYVVCMTSDARKIMSKFPRRVNFSGMNAAIRKRAEARARVFTSNRAARRLNA